MSYYIGYYRLNYSKNGREQGVEDVGQPQFSAMPHQHGAHPGCSDAPTTTVWYLQPSKLMQLPHSEGLMLSVTLRNRLSELNKQWCLKLSEVEISGTLYTAEMQVHSYHIIDRPGDREGVHNKKRSRASEDRHPSPASPSSKEALRAHWQLVSKT